MPLIRRIPKRGFNNVRHKVKYAPVNVGALERFESGEVVDQAKMRSVGLVNGSCDGVKLLGNGTLTKCLTVIVDAASASASAKVIALGGSIQTEQAH